MGAADSILTSVKKLCGIDQSMDVFDQDIIININSAIAVLTQLGIGPEEGYCITDASQTYGDFLGDQITKTNFVKQYLFMKTKLGFDTSSMSSSVLAAMQKQVEELEWRLNIEHESKCEVLSYVPLD